MNQGISQLARRVYFSCMHLYEVKDWSAQKNMEIFGACYSQYGHGHNYQLEAYFSGPIDVETGMIINLSEVDKILHQAIAPIHEKHLNFEIEDFKNKVPTTENLILYLADKIQNQLSENQVIHLERLRLYESENLWVDWMPS